MIKEKKCTDNNEKQNYLASPTLKKFFSFFLANPQYFIVGHASDWYWLYQIIGDQCAADFLFHKTHIFFFLA
jgi:hypothetical protein